MFERSTARAILADVEAALKEVATKHGVTLSVGRTSLGIGDMTTKLTFTDGANVDLGKKEWEIHCGRFGLTPEDFGRRFKHRGTEFTVCGIKPKSFKYPIIGVNANGTRYKFPATMLMVQ